MKKMQEDSARETDWGDTVDRKGQEKRDTPLLFIFIRTLKRSQWSDEICFQEV